MDLTVSFLSASNGYDVNFIANDCLDETEKIFDYLLIDDAHDFNSTQLCLMFKLLKEKGKFMLCVDPNKMICPSIFLYVDIKNTLPKSRFPVCDHEITTKKLFINYQHTFAITQLANQVLKLKNTCFELIEEEKNQTMINNLPDKGHVFLLQKDQAFIVNPSNETFNGFCCHCFVR